MDGKALGKGLSALIPEMKGSNIKEENVLHLKTGLILDNPLQPRGAYNEVKLEELKSSIREKGVLQPLIVRRTTGNKYEVVAGERRLRASRALNLDHVPVIIRNLSDQEALIIALIENIQREDLNPIEEAEAYRKLIEEFQFTHEHIAQNVGKDRSTVSNLVRLLKLPNQIQKSISEGKISVGHARALLCIESLMEREKIFKEILLKGLSVREVENLINSQNRELGNRREKLTKTKNHEIIALEENLQKILGTKVRIQSSKKRGKIIIDYYSFGDLERILKILKP